MGQYSQWVAIVLIGSVELFEWYTGLVAWQQQLIAISGIVVATTVVAFVVRSLASFLSRQLARRTKTELDDRLIRAFGRTIYWLVQLYGAGILVRYLRGEYTEVHDIFFEIADGVIYVLIVYVIVRLIYRIINILQSWYTHTIAVKTETRLDDEFLPLIARALKTVAVILATMAVLSHFEVDIKGLVAVLGVSSLAIALAAQDTLANMIAGFIIMLDRPFKVGDRVILPSGEKVDVFEIGLRSTKFKTFENTLVIVPNNELAKTQITNLSYPEPAIRVRVDVGVAYGSDLNSVKQIMLRAAEIHPDVLKDPVPRVYFLAFGESELSMSLWARSDSFKSQWRIEEELRCDVYQRFEQEGVEIPFPQRVIHLPASAVSNGNTEPIPTAT